MILTLLEHADLNINSAARYLGVTPQTIRRYIAQGYAPRATIEALRRAKWIAPEAVEYLELLAIRRWQEAMKKFEPKITRLTLVQPAAPRGAVAQACADSAFGAARGLHPRSTTGSGKSSRQSRPLASDRSGPQPEAALARRRAVPA